MAHVGSARRVGYPMCVAGLVVLAGGCGGDAGGLAAATPEVGLTGDGCSANISVGSDAPILNGVVEPSAEQGVVAWSEQVAGGSEIEVVTATNEVVFVGAGASVTAYALEDGKQRWQQVVDVGDLRRNLGAGEALTTFISQLAVGDVVAVAASEPTMTSHGGSNYFSFRTVVAAFDEATGSQLWVTDAIQGGPVTGSSVLALRIIDDIVVVGVTEDLNDMVWAFDAATGSPRWRIGGQLAGGATGAAFVYQRHRCLIQAVGVADGVVMWTLPTPPQSAWRNSRPVQVVPYGDDVIVSVWEGLHAPVVLARINVSTGADVWRMRFPEGGWLDVDAVIDGSSVRVAIERTDARPAVPTLIDVFELDPNSGETRWATRVLHLGLDPAADADDMLAANPFLPQTRLTIIPGGSTIGLSTGSELYTLSASDGTIARMVEVEGSLANLIVVDPSRRLVMRSVSVPAGVVVTAADTVALIH